MGRGGHPLPKGVRAWGAVFNTRTSFFRKIMTFMDRIRGSRETFKKLVTNKNLKALIGILSSCKLHCFGGKAFQTPLANVL